MAPATPIVCAAYLVPMWSAIAWKLATSQWTSGATLLTLCAALAGVLWAGYYILVSGIRRYLIRSDEVDLLMQELRDRNNEVEALRAAAAADLETRSAVFASASHDLRQRIYALKLFANTGAAKEGMTSPLRRMAAVVEELEVFVTEILQFVQFENPRAQKSIEVTPLQEVLQGIELQFEFVAAEKHARLRTRATKLCVRTDAVMLGRILENLVSNALKATNKDVLVVARKRRGSVCLEVWDQGRGIDTDLLHPASSHVSVGIRGPQDGFGLGLTIVRRLAKKLGYTIEVHSRASHGTRVRIVIPRDSVV